ncbi:Wzz/FepE/Etk N-terminal domain-containing protein [Petrimonas sp.]|uniref:Wzz/FepE/Etk N-terminal domain-containing protein n=1 Tax=Petrimonas sp. TaxID=2023866 RepID=UPI002FCA288A
MEQLNHPVINSVENNSDEIDLTELLRKLWAKRIFILKVTALFLLLGLFVALFSPVQYTSTCTVVPQSGKDKPGGGLGGVAAMMGVNLGTTMMNEGTLSPVIYPEIVKSVPFTREIMKTKVIVEKSKGRSIDLQDYYSDSQYQKFNLLGVIKKYTLGLPGVLFGALRSDKASQVVEHAMSSDSVTIYTLTKEEKLVYDVIQKSIQIEPNPKDGYVTLGYTFSEAQVAAVVTDQLYRKLEAYVSRFKTEKLEDNLAFVEQSYETARKDFINAQNRLALFQDANRGLTTASAISMETRLRNEYDVAYTLYRELATQREQAKIAVKENQTILTLVNPPYVPLEKSSPRKSIILIGFLFLGIVVACGWVLSTPYLKELFKEIREE